MGAVLWPRFRLTGKVSTRGVSTEALTARVRRPLGIEGASLSISVGAALWPRFRLIGKDSIGGVTSEALTAREDRRGGIVQSSRLHRGRNLKLSLEVE